MARNYTPKIKKEDLIPGAYYAGTCRNATLARWNGEEFVYWRDKFGQRFLETIKCPEDDQHFDVFVAEMCLDPNTDIKEEYLIPLKTKQKLDYVKDQLDILRRIANRGINNSTNLDLWQYALDEIERTRMYIDET